MYRILALLALVPIAAIGLLLATGAASAPTDVRAGQFVPRCPVSHHRQVDPIVAPGVEPTDHMHEFFGNVSTNKDSTYASMTAAGTTCTHSGDTAAYWTPALKRPDGSTVTAIRVLAYYNNRPVSYSQTQAHPPDFRMVAGGVGSKAIHAFWKCDNSGTTYATPPLCSGGNYLIGRVIFPQCGDGRTDSPDHRSHVKYATGSSCPASHPIKFPDIHLQIRYCANCGGPGWKLSDGTTVLHGDFWNTWKQSAYEDLVARCLRGGVNCGIVSG